MFKSRFPLKPFAIIGVVWGALTVSTLLLDAVRVFVYTTTLSVFDSKQYAYMNAILRDMPTFESRQAYLNRLVEAGGSLYWRLNLLLVIALALIFGGNYLVHRWDSPFGAPNDSP